MNYCSDFNFRGLCGYDDNDLSCTCSETMNDSHRAYMSGMCTSDQVRLWVRTGSCLYATISNIATTFCLTSRPLVLQLSKFARSVRHLC